MSLIIRFYKLLNGVVASKNDKNLLYITNKKYVIEDFYRLGTKTVTLSQLFTRNNLFYVKKIV